jgi:hypothetical protein
MNRFVHGRIEPLSELRKSSTAGQDGPGDGPAISRLAAWLSVISTIVYFLASHGVANFFRWLFHAAGKAAS